MKQLKTIFRQPQPVLQTKAPTKPSKLKPMLLATVAALVATSVFAQQANSKRLLKIVGAPKGDLTKGPLTYTGNPLKATVSTLNIKSQKAVVSAPAGKALSESTGKRNADFTGNVVVTRSRLTAKGSKLAYSESTGKGILTGKPSAVFAPDKDSDSKDPVYINATKLSLDVDTDVSTSTGNVKLKNGNQTAAAQTLVFDEDKELAQLTGKPSLTRAKTAKKKELVISGQEVRALTAAKTLYVKGKVKLVQGSQITTGDAVYYDDTKNIAYVVGNARSEDTKSKVVVKAPSSGYLEQRTDLGRVSAKNSTYKIPVGKFKLRGEK